jgi:hypothetical protein
MNDDTDNLDSECEAYERAGRNYWRVWVFFNPDWERWNWLDEAGNNLLPKETCYAAADLVIDQIAEDMMCFLTIRNNQLYIEMQAFEGSLVFAHLLELEIDDLIEFFSPEHSDPDERTQLEIVAATFERCASKIRKRLTKKEV